MTEKFACEILLMNECNIFCYLLAHTSRHTCGGVFGDSAGGPLRLSPSNLDP